MRRSYSVLITSNNSVIWNDDMRYTYVLHLEKVC